MAAACRSGRRSGRPPCGRGALLACQGVRPAVEGRPAPPERVCAGDADKPEREPLDPRVKAERCGVVDRVVPAGGSGLESLGFADEGVGDLLRELHPAEVADALLLAKALDGRREVAAFCVAFKDPQLERLHGSPPARAAAVVALARRPRLDAAAFDVGDLLELVADLWPQPPASAAQLPRHCKRVGRREGPEVVIGARRAQVVQV